MSRSSVLTMRHAAWCVALAVTTIAPFARSVAQGKVVGIISDQRMPDSAQLAASLAASMRMRSPAALALSMKQELGLTPEQVGAVEALVPVEADSQRVRMGRVIELKRPRAGASTAMMTTSWTGSIDEAVIRAALCEQSRAQAELVIGMMRDRHALGVLLTADQQGEFDRLQSEMMMRAMGSAPK